MLNNVDTEAASARNQFYRIPFLELGPLLATDKARIVVLISCSGESNICYSCKKFNIKVQY